ncbi:MAG TPA: MEDS domain-containing protein [Solirubrobacterales bacterium]|jgi:hypothetical protein|nr:MEDS domain-containing protein [Solirubrobacterales bacterium]
MRAHGCIDSAAGLGSDGHACWGFDRPEEFVEAAIEFLEDGLRHGQRLAYVGSESLEEQRERLAPLGDVGRMLDSGMLQLFELGHLYRVGEPVDPEAQMAIYLGATEAAQAEGCSGLRVAAEVTDLVTAPQTWEAHLRWESAADRLLAPKSLAALCGYRREALPPQLMADLAAVHPAANAAAEIVPFHLFGEGEELALSGEVDLFSSDALERVLDLAGGDGEPASLNLEALEFIDHHGAELLARRGCRAPATRRRSSTASANCSS